MFVLIVIVNATHGLGVLAGLGAKLKINRPNLGEGKEVKR
jgi:hypothetical protein